MDLSKDVETMGVNIITKYCPYKGELDWPNTTGISVTNANPAGSVASFSLMNPYIVVYMWERTA